jgi:hypothetical protein
MVVQTTSEKPRDCPDWLVDLEGCRIPKVPTSQMKVQYGKVRYRLGARFQPKSRLIPVRARMAKSPGQTTNKPTEDSRLQALRGWRMHFAAIENRLVHPCTRNPGGAAAALRHSSHSAAFTRLQRFASAAPV